MSTRLRTLGTEKVARNRHNGKTKQQHSQHTEYLFFVYSVNIHTQTGYYKKGIRHLFANFLGCNITKYCKNLSAFD